MLLQLILVEVGSFVRQVAEISDTAARYRWWRRMSLQAQLVVATGHCLTVVKSCEIFIRSLFIPIQTWSDPKIIWFIISLWWGFNILQPCKEHVLVCSSRKLSLFGCIHTMLYACGRISNTQCHCVTRSLITWWGTCWVLYFRPIGGKGMCQMWFCRGWNNQNVSRYSNRFYIWKSQLQECC